jgi:hypothetical protein
MLDFAVELPCIYYGTGGSSAFHAFLVQYHLGHAHLFSQTHDPNVFCSSPELGKNGLRGFGSVI